MDLLLTDVVVATPPHFNARKLAAVLVRDGLIAALSDVPLAVPPDVPRQSLARGVLYPGLCDSHVHAVSSGLALMAPSLRGVTSVDELHHVLASTASGASRFAVAGGYDETAWPLDRRLDRPTMDRLAPRTPLIVTRIDLHSCWVNSAALTRLRLPRTLEGLEDSASGWLRGPAYYAAAARVRRWYDDRDRERGLQTLARHAVARGITSLHCLEGAPSRPDPERHAAVSLLGRLPLRTRTYLQCFDVDGAVRAGLCQIGGCLLLDGSLGSRTAALDSPYSDRPGESGLLYWPTERIESLVRRAESRGLQCTFHAIGPRAIEQLLGVYERVLGRTPGRDHRHRIEHFLVPRPDQIDRAAALGLGLGVQPTFHHLWGRPGGMYEQRLGSGRLASINPLARLAAAGIPLGGGSDFDVTPLEPLLGVRAACEHPVADQRLSRARALDMWVSGSRHLGFEDDAGRIEVGARADLCWMSDDLMQVSTDEITNVHVLGTWVGGQSVFTGQ